jgi:starvation-inducible DNA-binding protein
MTAQTNGQAQALDSALADLLDLGLLAKQVHWNVVGPRFRSMHLLLDELAAVARDGADQLAERAATLGHAPDGRAVTIAEFSSLPALACGQLPDTEAIPAFVAVLEAVAASIYSALEHFEKDYVTADLLIGVLAAVEKYTWMLRAQGDA